MKVAYLSDLHLEFKGRDFDLPDADVLLMAGDILLAKDLENIKSDNHLSSKQFLIEVSKKYKEIIWIPGNHEYYKSSIIDVPKLINKFLQDEKLTNITFSECGYKVIDDVNFVFATLWTDLNKGNPLTMSVGTGLMNDYSEIQMDSENLLNPKHTFAIHKFDKKFIEKNIKLGSKVFVVTHNSPSLMSVTDRDIEQMSYYYCCTDMDDLFFDNPQIKFWVHGHLHSHIQYMINDTLVLSNCRGYAPYEALSRTFKVKVVEI